MKPNTVDDVHEIHHTLEAWKKAHIDKSPEWIEGYEQASEDVIGYLMDQQPPAF